MAFMYPLDYLAHPMPIDRDLFDLLYEHDCVIVPRWGGFLAQYRPARLDKARNLVHPPTKEVGYNRHLLRNDGLLADRLALREGIDHAEAVSLLDKEVETWRSALEKTGRLELPRIGIFFHDAEKNLQFDPDERTNFLKDSFGLRPVAALPVQERKVVPMSIPTLEPVEVVERERSNWIWAAATAAILVSAATWWVYAHPNANLGGGLANTESKTAPTYTPTTELPELVTNAAVFTLPEETLGIREVPVNEAGLTVTVDLGRKSPESLTKVAEKDSTRVVLPKRTGTVSRFNVIGGCFAQPENADRLLDQLQEQGYTAVRLPKRGQLYPVAYGSFPDRSSALGLLEQIRTKGSAQAWLLVN